MDSMYGEYMTAAEAASFLNRTKRCITRLCLNGKLSGAKKIGEKMWMIPKQAVLNFQPSPQGFAVTRPREKALKEEKKRAELDEINAAIKFFGSQKLAIA